MRLSKQRAEEAIYLNHAVRAMTDRDVTIEEVEKALTQPETVWGPDHRGRYNFACGDICVVANPSPATAVIITVLWREQKQWTNEEMRRRRDGANRTDR